MPFVNVRDLKMYYETRGQGPRLLAINGTGGDLRRSPNILDLPFTQRFETVSYDQRGLGQTSKPDRPYTMADYAEDAAALLDVLGWESCMVLGYSFGGMVAQELALRYPHRVERLILACTSSGGAGGSSYPLHELAGLSPEEHAIRILEISDVRLNAAWREANPERLRALVEQRLAEANQFADEPGRAMGARRQLEARAQHDTYDRLPQLTMPVFVCGGRYDGLAKPECLEALAARIPNARLEFFEGGHLFTQQDKRAAERMEAFLRGELD